MNQDLIALTTDYSEIRPSLLRIIHTFGLLFHYLELKLQKSIINQIKQKINSFREENSPITDIKIEKQLNENIENPPKKTKNNLQLEIREDNMNKKIKLDSMSYVNSFTLDEGKYSQYFSKYKKTHVNITLVSSLKNQEVQPINLVSVQNFIKEKKLEQILYQQYMGNYYGQRSSHSQNVINMNNKIYTNKASVNTASYQNDYLKELLTQRSPGNL